MGDNVKHKLKLFFVPFLAAMVACMICLPVEAGGFGGPQALKQAIHGELEALGITSGGVYTPGGGGGDFTNEAGTFTYSPDGDVLVQPQATGLGTGIYLRGCDDPTDDGGGSVTVEGGQGSGSVHINGGNSSISSAENGGNVILSAGQPDSGGTMGYVEMTGYYSAVRAVDHVEFYTQSPGGLGGTGTTAYLYVGTGDPENTLTAAPGSIYIRAGDGGTGTMFYVKETGSGNTGWVAK